MKKLFIGIGVAAALIAVSIGAWYLNKQIHPYCDCIGPQICDGVAVQD